MDSLPIIELDAYLTNRDSAEAVAECQKAANALRDYGALIVRDPRVTEEDNYRFLDMVEDYFGQSEEKKMKDTRPELGYQVGATPGLQEAPKCGYDPHCQDVIDKMPEESRPRPIEGPDPKWRFFWRIGEQPESSQFPRLNAEPVIPEGFPYWATTMNTWGTLMHQAVLGLTEMVTVGFGLPSDTITRLTKGGPHLLAPTASDLNLHGKVGTVLAGFHYDFNLLTIHGKSRYPGLYIWPRNGSKKLPVSIPDGCLLVQAGREMEWLTGGQVLAGYHEVIVSDATVKAIEKAKTTRPDRPLWRISSTFFLHVASDELLRPLSPVFDSTEANTKYTKVLTGHYVNQELSGINLMVDKTSSPAQVS